MTTLDELAKALQVSDRQLRVGDGNRIIAIAGTLGIIKPASDGVPTITSRDADFRLLRELIDIGVLSRVFGTETYRLRRMPADDAERLALRTWCGLLQDKESAA